jgi:CRP-like cAMP-binding protein
MTKFTLRTGEEIYNALNNNRMFVYVIDGTVNLYGY